jgi:zinc protease
MSIHRLRRISALIHVSVLAVLLGGLSASPLAQPSFNPQDPIPFDAAVRTGSLSNGLRFFVRRNERPAKRVSLRLVVKAGSLNELDDEQGLAHFIEHMAFNGSEHFKPGELVSYFESTGARLGPHVNAYTSFDETVYMLDLPTDSAEVVRKGLTALADFAGGLSFIPEEVDKERGVVIEEWRGRLGAGSRLRDKQTPVLYYQSRYANRIPIGKPEIIRTAPPARLRAFYDTWYRPERMAVVAVGDVDAAQIEQDVRSQFGSLRDRAPSAPMPNQSVPLHQQFLVSVATDPEITQTSVSIIHKRPKESARLVADYRRDIVERLLDEMFDDRLSELARKPDAQFLSAGVDGGSLGPQVETFSVSVRAIDGRLAEALTAMMMEVRRVRQFGFTAPELDRTKRSLLAVYERAYSERDKSESGSFAQEYVNYALEEEPTPGVDYEYHLVQQVMPTITLDEVTALARRRLADDCRVMLAVLPEKAGSKPPTEGDLRAAITTAEMAAIVPWNDTSSTRALMVSQPEAGQVVSRRELPDIGVTVVRFSNGVEAWLKPTDFKNDQVVFTMYALGGASFAPPADFLNVSLAASYVSRSGIQGLNAIEIQKLLAGKIASASPSVSLSTHGFSGSAAPAELETSLQLLYQEFKAPGDDPDAFGLMKRQLEAAVANRGQSPGQVFGECLEKVNTSNHYTSQPLTPERVATLDRAKMLAAYKERFANAADFTFFMVGTFRTDDVIPMLATYLGSLPGTGKRTAGFKDVGLHFPSSIERTRCAKGREPRSQTAISFFADPPPDPMEAEKIIEATTVLETTLRDILREDLGQTYTVSVGQDQPLPQRGAGLIEVSFGAAPENIDSMTERVLQEVRRLQREGPSADLTAKAKESARRNYETNLRQNGYWLRRLESVHLLGEDPKDILTRPARIDAITTAMLKETFNTYFPLDRYTVVTLVPESGGSSR